MRDSSIRIGTAGWSYPSGPGAWTGIVYPDGVHFPDGERTAYTAAAVLLAADTISGTSPASDLFMPDDHPGGVDPGVE